MTLENRMRRIAVAVVFGCLLSVMPLAQAGDNHDAKLKEATEQSVRAGKVFDEIMQTPDKAIPRDLLARAKAVAVFPHVIKAAFVVGAEGGRGVLSRRTNTGWSDPVFFRAGGPSVGPQAGASATDIVLVLMNDDAIAHLMKDRFELGADAAVAGGPVGREAGAGTDALMHAEILSYSRSRGLFAGVNLKGVIIQPEDDLNEALYNKTARELLVEENPKGPDPADNLHAFTRAIAQYAPSTDHSQSPRVNEHE